MTKKAEQPIPIESAWLTWKDCIKSNDQNSIFQQITLMIWDSAIFRLILENRREIIEFSPVQPPINGSLQSFIDRTFFQSQVASIRRLVDKSPYGLTGKKGVYSLSALIKDLKEYREDLTREKYFHLRNLPYDYSKIAKMKQEYINKQSQTMGVKFFEIPKDLDSETAAEAHASFDHLCGKTLDERDPKDKIQENVYSRLHEKLDTCTDIIKYVDKFIAHAATPESRNFENIDKIEITLKNIRDAHRTIYEVAQFWSGFLFAEDHVPLALEPPFMFQHWMIFSANDQDNERLKTVFNRYREETEQWRLEGVKNLWNWAVS
jgi:hypothetical protein